MNVFTHFKCLMIFLVIGYGINAECRLSGQTVQDSTQLPILEKNLGFLNDQLTFNFESSVDKVAFIKNLKKIKSPARKVLFAFYLDSREFSNDFNNDKCLSRSDMKMYNALWEHWDNQPKLETQLQWERKLSLRYIEKESKLDGKFIELLRKQSHPDYWILMWQVIRHTKPTGDNGYFSAEELASFEETWKALLKASDDDIESYVISHLKVQDGCIPIKAHFDNTKDFSALKVADDLGKKILARMDEIEGFSLYSGKAGVAMVLGELYRQTGDTQYNQAAFDLMNKANSEYSPDPRRSGWLISGRTGMVQAAISLYKSTGKKEYIEYAKEWAMELKPVDGATDHSWGAAGIALTLLNLYKETNEKKWLRKVIKMTDFLEKKVTVSKLGAYWPLSNDNPESYAGFGHGSAGIGYVLLKMFDVTQNKKYLKLAEQCAEFVINTSYRDNRGGLHWTWEQPMALGFVWKYQWSHGSPGMLPFFNELIKVKPSAKWQKAFDASLSTTMKFGLDFNGQLNGSQCCGRPGVGEVFLQMYNQTRDPKHLKTAKNFGSLLLNKDSQVEEKVNGENLSVDLSGMSGIALFFLRLNDPDKTVHPFYIF